MTGINFNNQTNPHIKNVTNTESNSKIFNNIKTSPNAQKTVAKKPAKNFSTPQVVGIAAATALGAATLAGIALSRRNNAKQQEAVRAAVNEAVERTQQTMQRTVQEANQRLQAQEEANRAMREVQEQLRASLSKAQERWQNQEDANKVLQEIQDRLEASLAEAQQRCTTEEETSKALRELGKRLQESLNNALEKCTTQEEANQALLRTQQELQDALVAAQNQCTTQENANKELQNIINSLNERLNAQEQSIAPSKTQDPIAKAYRAIKESLTGKKLNYDATKPPVSDKMAERYADAVELPSGTPTTNRSWIEALYIPDVEKSGRFSFQLPDSSRMKVVHEKRMPFETVYKRATTMSESYADSVVWDDNKIARDLLQNFYDGHGQTLDGVKIVSKPKFGGGYTVRIEGQGIYTPDKAIFIGESSKRENAKAAGNYGEGLKMSVLKILKDCGAEDVRIASDNWKLTYELGAAEMGDKRVLTYSLDKTLFPHNGNYVEFETKDIGLIQALRDTIGRFYHSGNTDFKCPDFENELMGIKILPKGQNGGLYIAGQKFEFNGQYEGLEGMTVFLKEKPPVKILDPSRDRTSLDKEKLGDIIGWVVSEERTTKEETLGILRALEPYWQKVSYLDKKPGHRACENALINMKYKKGLEDLHINFPNKYIAYSSASPELVADIESRGYIVCEENMHKFGMKNIAEFMQEVRAHSAFTPTETEEKKINIIKEALKNFSSLKDKHFSEQELDTKIFLFDAKGQCESEMTDNAVAEAIVNKGVSQGFWIDRNYLETASFGDVLETALHELSHKAGGDESSAFSYKLTDVNSSVYQQILRNKETMTNLEALNRLWNELNNTSAPIAA